MTEAVQEVVEQVSVPKSADAVAQALAKFSVDIIAAKKAGASGPAFIAAAAAALTDLEPAISAISGVGAEIDAEPVDVAEAFAIAGFKVARQISGK